MMIDKMMHQAHLSYQRRQLAGDRHSMPSAEVRGVRRQMSRHEMEVVFRMEWFTHLRPNFWKAYFDTLSKM